MFRNFGSAFVHRFALPRLAGPAIVAALLSSFAAFGCSSTSNNPETDAGPTQPTNCDITQMETLFTKRLCTSGGCHNSTGDSANLNLTADGLAGRLVGKNPAGGGLLASMCANMTPAKVYLVAGSQPATGLFIDKIQPGYSGCGMRMPYGGSTALTTDEISCIQSWANSVTK